MNHLVILVLCVLLFSCKDGAVPLHTPYASHHRLVQKKFSKKYPTIANQKKCLPLMKLTARTNHIRFERTRLIKQVMKHPDYPVFRTGLYSHGNLKPGDSFATEEGLNIPAKHLSDKLKHACFIKTCYASGNAISLFYVLRKNKWL